MRSTQKWKLLSKASSQKPCGNRTESWMIYFLLIKLVAAPRDPWRFYTSCLM
uniref:BCL2 like 15 n=1 Tax=Molossus molossus TaxID=27622 RepID=A0A7J8CPW9_MOLMO|nr:BCL2 like 15 [Molossus molossus]